MGIRSWIGSLCLAACLSGCGGETAADPARSSAPGEQLGVSAAFYPLQYLAERVGGDRVAVTPLAPPGAEPHDLELTPRDVARLRDSDLVVHLGGFQPAVDEAVRQAGAAALDVAGPARLERSSGAPADPHFWLDPQRMTAVADALAARLGEADPAGSTTYRGNAQALGRDLAALDAEYRTGLASCRDRTLVTGHHAFGYLAQRYGLRQVAISGLSPEDEPTPGELAEVTRLVRQHGVGTVYDETLAGQDIARTVAAETGVRTAVLDPLESLTEASPGADYLEVMRANLATLREGQRCP